MVSIEGARTRFRGAVVDATHPHYSDARRVWNQNIDRRPTLIVRCSGVADVIEAVNLARANGLALSVRGGGHNIAGHATCDGGIVVDLGSMKSVRIDPVARVAQVEDGATWADVDREAQVFGLATTGGMISNTGVGGLTLGGGLGWLMGVCGLSCNNLISADLVTADGRFIKASATENLDLFWGLRGGGGNFGIVTAFDFRLHPIGSLAGWPFIRCQTGEMCCDFIATSLPTCRMKPRRTPRFSPRPMASRSSR